MGDLTPPQHPRGRVTAGGPPKGGVPPILSPTSAPGPVTGRDLSPFVTVSPASQWFALRTSSRREWSVASMLEDRKVTVWLPVETRWGTRRGIPVRTRIDSPLLPSYLFVLTPETALAEVRKLEGIHEVVGCYDEDGETRPLAIPAAFILGMQIEEASGVYDRTRRVKPPPYRPKKGARVKATCGPYLGFLGRVLDTPKDKRALVMMDDPLARGVTIPVDYLTAA